MLIGSAEEIERAFEAAGWVESDPMSTGSYVRTYFSIVKRKGYQNAPMSTMLLGGARSELEFQKSLNSFAKRHHLRVWKRPQSADGENVWVASATEDIGITFSRKARNFTHAIDGKVDHERTKVVGDLLYTGCVDEAGLLDRHNLAGRFENASGNMETDGRVAVLKLNDCTNPRVMPGVGFAAQSSGAIRRILGSFRTEVIRSNFISLAYNGTRLSTATRNFFFGKKEGDASPAALTRQQSEWLAPKPAPTSEMVSGGDDSLLIGTLLDSAMPLLPLR
jgi:hypothetical protein